MSSPSLWIVVAVVGGAVAGVEAGVRAGDAAALALLMASIALLAGRASPLSWYLLLGACGCAMFAGGAYARDRAVAPTLLTWFEESTRRASQGGNASSAVLVDVDGTLTADATVAPTGVVLAIDVHAVTADGVHLPVRGRLQAHVSGDLAVTRLREWTRGRRVRSAVTMRRPRVLSNFGAASPAREVLRRPFALVGVIKSAALVYAEPGRWWDERAAFLRWRVRDATSHFIAPRSRDAAAIATAILIGDRAGLVDQVERRLQDAGTYHVIAISGGNVALLIAMCFGGLRLLVRSPRIVSAATLVVVAGFGWLVGGEASVARAVTVAGVYLVLGVVGLQPSPVATLRAAAAVLVAVDPLIVLDIGAWLSFSATLGIVTFGRNWASRLQRAGRRCLPVRLIRPVVFLVVATIAAELLLTPVSAAVFSRVSLAGLLLNILAIPAMAAIQLGGLFVCVTGSAWPAGAGAAALVVKTAADVLVGSSNLVEVLPWLTWRVPPTAVIWYAAYYLCLVVVRHSTARVRVAAGLTATACLVVIVSGPGVEQAQPARGRMRVTMLDVGQGEAVLVQTPARRALLIDAGGTPGSFDIGARVVTPALWALGVRNVEWLALSHGDRDHAGGAPSVVRDLAPREIWEGVPVPADPDRLALRALSVSAGASWRTVFAGAHLESGGVVIDVLHPPPPEWERQKVRNDDSVVLRVRYGRVEFWLTGDAGAEFERTIRSEDDSPRLRILKVGHHGSRSATGADLLEKLRPEIALISAGRDNLFGHPSRDVLARLAASGVAVFRTDADGAIVVESDGVTARVLTASGRSWSVTLSSVGNGLWP